MLAKTKHLYTIIGIVLMLLVIGYSAVYLLANYYINTHHTKELIVQKLSSLLGREIEIADQYEFNVSWDLLPHIVVHKLAVANVAWSTNQHILTADDLDITLNLLGLFDKKIDIVALNLLNPVLLLEKRDNNNNWTFGEEQDSKSNFDLELKQLNITNGKLRYIQDGVTTVDLSAKGLQMSGHMDDTEWDVVLDGILNGTPIKTNFHVEVDDQEIALEIHNYVSGDSDLSGKLAIKLDTMAIKAELSSKYLALSNLIPETPQDTGTYSVPDISFPVEKLRSAPFDIKVSVNNLVFHKFTLHDVKLHGKNKDKILSLTLNPAAKLVNGSIDALLKYDLSQKNPNMQLAINTSKISLGQLIKEALGDSPIQGSDIDLHFNVNGYGDNLRSIVASSSGQILAQASAGSYLIGYSGVTGFFTQIFQNLLTFKKTDPNINFSCAVINFRINNGIASSKNGIALEATSVKVQGGGTVNLNNGSLNINIQPHNTVTSMIDFSQFSVAQVVKIRGTINDPQVSFNPLSLITSSSLLNASALTKLAGGITSVLPTSVATAAQGLLDTKSAENIEPCKTALAE